MRPMTDEHRAILRRHMVEVIGIHVELIREELGKNTLDERVMAALQRVPRHLFVPVELIDLAYSDTPLPVGFNKTISQPFIAALMIDLLAPEDGDKVLEVGTGLGYQAAILAQLAHQVWSVEVVEEFVAEAKMRLEHLGILNVGVRVGDGSKGWAEHAPFDRILVTAATERVPLSLVEQLKPGGRMVLPLGPPEVQALTVVEKENGTLTAREIIAVQFTELETVV